MSKERVSTSSLTKSTIASLSIAASIFSPCVFPIPSNAEGTTPFFDFKTKLENNDANKIAAKEAEAKALEEEGVSNFKKFENAAIQAISKEEDSNVVFIDKKNGFMLNIPPSWTSKSKSVPTPSMEKYQEETVLLTGQSFVEVFSN